jgi:CubicO group peptidase (beta-lactamase class C family)
MVKTKEESVPRNLAPLNRRKFLGVMAGTVGAATAGGAVLSACGSSSGATPPLNTGPLVIANAFESIAPTEVSLVPISSAQVASAVSGLTKVANDMLATTKVPGMAIAVVSKGRVVYAKGFGVRKVGQPGKVDTNTVFQVASLSKAIASTVVAGLVGQDVVAWDDPLIHHLPSFSMGDPYVTANVTIADMFSHRSGLPDHAGDLLEDLGFDQAQIFARMQYYPMDPFRATYAYSNFGLTVGAVAAATAKGAKWEDLSQQVLYGPLGMASTSSRYADYVAASNRADLHVRVDGQWQAKYQRDPDPESPAGGVSSSISDMAKWLQLQLAAGKFNGQQVVDADALQVTHVPHFTNAPATTPAGKSGFYGLGFNVGADGAGRLRLTHSGAFGLGAATAFDMMPSEELGIVTLTNGMPIGLPEALNAAFMDMVETGNPTRDWLKAFTKRFAPFAENPSKLAGKTAPSNPIPAQPDAAYVGTYTNNVYGPAIVGTGPNGLTLTLGPTPQVFPLTHWDGNVFSYFPIGENAAGIAEVTFAIGPGGQAASVNVENLNGNPPISETLGTFQRS